MLTKYDIKVKEIQEELIAIGENVVDALDDALSCIKNNELNKFNDINVSLKKIENKSIEIDNTIITTLALHNPEATDLREMVAYLRSTNELIRAAKNTKEFLKLFKKAFRDDLNTSNIIEYTIPILKSTKLSMQMAISMVVEENRDEIIDRYQKIKIEETKTDDLYAMAEKNILKFMTKNQDLSREYFDILSALRRLERTSDRAVALANLLRFAEVGGEL